MQIKMIYWILSNKAYQKESILDICGYIIQYMCVLIARYHTKAEPFG